MKLPCLILIFIIVDAEHHLFSRLQRVADTDHSVYTLSSNTASNHAVCAKNCKSEDCLSFSYTAADKRCETYSRSIGGKTDVGPSMSTMYFAKVFSSCSEVPQKHPSGIYRIGTRKGIGVDMFCEMDTAEGPWMVIQRRTKGDVDFYRGWNDYKYGFGDLLGDFWIGNENLHLLTNISRTLRVELEGWDGTRGYAQYSIFRVSHEDQNYTLNVNGFTGNVSFNAITGNNDQSFTTYDRDNDQSDTSNCAEYRHSGWWFFDCTRVNLNGRYQSHRVDLRQAMTWANFPDDQIYFSPLKTTTMKIR
ncbi:angiopoietin-related protein 7-like [Pecten maximus]|uniref:angiopoietin-related protein 7-like n=1 Tax=Pecten maximus TaxID=6579 RepID=UPI0014580D6D|nr:angiopoietin-related protein 7-like [Pecten maximus]